MDTSPRNLHPEQPQSGGSPEASQAAQVSPGSPGSPLSQAPQAPQAPHAAQAFGGYAAPLPGGPEAGEHVTASGAHSAAVPPVPPMPPASRNHAKPGRRRGVAFVVAAALAAGLVGGTAGGFIHNAVDGSPAAVSIGASSGAAPVQSVADQNLTGVAAVANAVLPSVVEISVQSRRGSATGSGLILSEDGKILTNAHVVSDSDGATITVKFSDGRTATARVVGSDTASDLAVLKADNVTGLKPATLGDSATVAVGDTVVAIGSPEGLTGTVTSGIVSALDREVKVPTSDDTSGSLPFGSPYGSAANTQTTTTYKAIQTDASINPGNSGGPLLDMNGRVVGINSANYSVASGGSNSEGGSVGLGFAIPINQVKTLLTDLESGTSA